MSLVLANRYMDDMKTRKSRVRFSGIADVIDLTGATKHENSYRSNINDDEILQLYRIAP